MANEETPKQFLPTDYKVPYQTKEEVIAAVLSDVLDIDEVSAPGTAELIKQLSSKMSNEECQRIVDTLYETELDTTDEDQDYRLRAKEGTCRELLIKWLTDNFRNHEAWEEEIDDILDAMMLESDVLLAFNEALFGEAQK